MDFAFFSVRRDVLGPNGTFRDEWDVKIEGLWGEEIGVIGEIGIREG